MTDGRNSLDIWYVYGASRSGLSKMKVLGVDRDRLKIDVDGAELWIDDKLPVVCGNAAYGNTPRSAIAKFGEIIAESRDSGTAGAAPTVVFEADQHGEVREYKVVDAVGSLLYFVDDYNYRKRLTVKNGAMTQPDTRFAYGDTKERALLEMVLLLTSRADAAENEMNRLRSMANKVYTVACENSEEFVGRRGLPEPD